MPCEITVSPYSTPFLSLSLSLPLFVPSTTVAPSQVTVTGPTEARVGDVVPLTCATAPSNPPAEIKWMVGGRQIRNATSKTSVSPEGKFASTGLPWSIIHLYVELNAFQVAGQPVRISPPL